MPSFNNLNWPWIIATLLYTLLLLAGFAYLNLRFRNLHKIPPLPTDLHLTHLRGWLAFFGVVLFLALFGHIASLLKNLPFLVLKSRWDMFTDPSYSAKHPLWQPLIIYETWFGFLLLILQVSLIILYFKQHPVFIKGILLLLICNAIYQVLDAVMIQFLPVDPKFSQQRIFALPVALLSGLIWGLYFSVSKRARAVFSKEGKTGLIYFFQENKIRVLPFLEHALAQLHSGAIPPTTLAWKHPLECWIPLQNILHPESSIPIPPLPPPAHPSPPASHPTSNRQWGFWLALFAYLFPAIGIGLHSTHSAASWIKTSDVICFLIWFFVAIPALLLSIQSILERRRSKIKAWSAIVLSLIPILFFFTAFLIGIVSAIKK